ncbi:Rrf2 family transcriptional regulator [Leptospira yasudae]|uniref:Transcriptional regulator n=1 Tax=Leptospira yasudae TaxID=2202201 RepID=A0A6N4QJM7_9LEPT|nr:Rrf2 family transcriptional regulator [Leptospira yasudae]TGL75198.1 transcriptional regulator [Leptospira yasudae]TGL77826.1 transcriptional regulator [Leptospira yasudae]TGL81233.1 transcriptional regulator [Leptospira yasudae]
MTSRFTVAIHILSLLSLREGKTRTSEELAESVNTNPVVIRKILSLLKNQGIVRNQMGPNGGYYLAKPATEINLKEIYEAIDEKIFQMHSKSPNKKCICGHAIQPILTKVYDKAQKVLEEELGCTNLDSITREILSFSKR